MNIRTTPRALDEASRDWASQDDLQCAVACARCILPWVVWLAVMVFVQLAMQLLRLGEYTSDEWQQWNEESVWLLVRLTLVIFDSTILVGVWKFINMMRKFVGDGHEVGLESALLGIVSIWRWLALSTVLMFLCSVILIGWSALQ